MLTRIFKKYHIGHSSDRIREAVYGEHERGPTAAVRVQIEIAELAPSTGGKSRRCN